MNCPNCGSKKIHTIYTNGRSEIKCYNCGCFEVVYLDMVLDRLFPKWYNNQKETKEK